MSISNILHSNMVKSKNSFMRIINIMQQNTPPPALRESWDSFIAWFLLALRRDTFELILVSSFWFPFLIRSMKINSIFISFRFRRFAYIRTALVSRIFWYWTHWTTVTTHKLCFLYYFSENTEYVMFLCKCGTSI